MEITGKIIAVLEARGGVSKATGNNWKTQDYVIETINEQFPRRMCFNVFGEDKINQMNIQVGDTLTVFFDINAREYQGRWFNDIRAWKVERGTGAPAAATEAAPFPPQGAAPAQPVDFSSENSADDLPF
jgi:hypothetical protein